MQNTVKYSPSTGQFVSIPADSITLGEDVVQQAEVAAAQGLPFVILNDGGITIAPTPAHHYYADKNKWLNYAYQFSPSQLSFWPIDLQITTARDVINITDDVHGKLLVAINTGLQYQIGADGDIISIAPSAAHDWDAKKGDWVINKTKQAELDKQVLYSADAQLTCLMSQMCAWLTVESYKPKSEQRGDNILSPSKIDEMLRGLPSSVETDLMRNAWSRATNIEFTNATTQSFAQMLGMSKDQLRVAMTEARGL